MALRNIVKINEQMCDGCGLCIIHCVEGALRIIDGKARLVGEVYCDGLGVCLGTCPQGAITIEQREADVFDEAAVKRQQAAAAGARASCPPGAAETAALPAQSAAPGATGGLPARAAGCPSVQLPLLQPAPPSAGARASCPPDAAQPAALPAQSAALQRSFSGGASVSPLSHWPVQLALVRPDAAFLRGADLLLVADCAPLAMADFHARLLRGRPVVLGCPKLDNRQAYVEKLCAIFQQAELRSLMIVHMEVPCCGGLSHIARTALHQSGRGLPIREVTVSIQGQVVAEENWP